MREFLIRTTAGHEWPGFHVSRIADVLVPNGWSAEPFAGDGDFAVRVGEATVSYSGDMPGWQVTICGELDREEEWIAAVTAQVAEAAGEPCEWIDVSG